MVTFTAFKGHESGKIQRTTINKPDTLEGDHVLVRVTASGVCATDLHYVSKPSSSYATFLPGLALTHKHKYR